MGSGPCAYLRKPATYASCRRFEGREIATLFNWIAIQSFYIFGVPPERPARFYQNVRGSDPERFIALEGTVTHWRTPPKARNRNPDIPGRRQATSISCSFFVDARWMIVTIAAAAESPTTRIVHSVAFPGPPLAGA